MSTPARAGRWLALAASVVVVATIAMAIAVMGTPGAQREARWDRKRVQDLQRIDRAVRQHAERHDALPSDLAALASQPGRRLAIADPRNGAPYAYAITGARRFRLCAVFATDTAPTQDGDYGPDDWSHGRGRQCFERSLKTTD